MILYGLKYRLLLIFFVTFGVFFSQKISLNYQFVYPDQAFKIPSYFSKKKSLSALSFLQNEKENAKILLAKKGYYSAKIADSLIDSTHLLLNVYLGKKYSEIRVRFSDEMLDATPIPWNQYENIGDMIVFKNPTDYGDVLQQIMSFYQNQGYPFSSLKYTNFSVESERVSLEVKMEKGRKMLWKEATIKGDSLLSINAMYQILNLKISSPFSVAQFNDIDRKLRQLSFVNVLKPSEMVFTTEGVCLFLYLESKKTSSFNGAIGFQPNPISQKLALTGELQLKLNNAFRRAEQLDFHWRSVQPATQSLNARFLYPYLFKTMLGTEMKFSLYKRDSTFLELKSNLSLQYTFSNGITTKALYQFNASNRLNAAATSSAFPNTKSFKNNMYGVGFSYRKIDYLPNPRKGIVLTLDALVGQRTVPSDSIPKNLTSRLAFSSEHFISLHKRWVFRSQLTFESYIAPVIYSNECYRFGGLTTLRGFNEEGFLATTKVVNQFELRYLLDQNSAVFIFFDQSFYEKNTQEGYRKDYPYGFGLGTNIGSKVGIFSLAYALGSEQNNPFDFRAGKIHFGYIAYF